MARNNYEELVKPRFEEIKEWRQSGFSERQIAEKLNISYPTLQNYKKSFQELKDLLLHSKGKLVVKLKKALWQEAMGYEYLEKEELVEKKPYKVIKKDPLSGKPERDELGNIIYITEHRDVAKIRKTTKYARPVPTLLMFALCNLCPEEFKRQDKEIESQIDELTNDIRELKNKYSDKLIGQAFDVLYPNVATQIKKENEKCEK